MLPGAKPCAICFIARIVRARDIPPRCRAADATAAFRSMSPSFPARRERGFLRSGRTPWVLRFLRFGISDLVLEVRRSRRFCCLLLPAPCEWAADFDRATPAYRAIHSIRG